MRVHRILRCLLATVAVLSVAGSVPLPAVDDGPELSFQLRENLSAALQKEATRLWNERNEAGHRFQRGSSARRFSKVDEGTYLAKFVVDTVSDDRMRTVSNEATIQGGGDRWEVTKLEPLGTYERLIREVPGDETFHMFDSFEFEHEGMHVTTGAGSLVIDYLLGEPTSLLVTGEGLTFDFTPPGDLGYQQSQIWAHLKETRPDHFSFEAEGMLINCDTRTCRKALDEKFAGLRDADRGQLAESLMRYYDKETKKQRELREEHPFRGFQLPLEPDRRFYTGYMKEKGKDRWLWLSYDNEDAWEVNIGASGYGRVIGYPSEETRTSGVEPYEVERRDDRDARRYEIVALDGKIEIGLDDAEHLRGDVTYTIRLKEAAQEIPFRLASLEEMSDSDRASGITVNRLENGDGSPMVYVRRGPTGGYAILTEKRPAGTEITLRMGYETFGSIRSQTPSFMYMERGGWLPFLRYTDKIEEFQLEVTVPDKYKTLGIGELVDSRTDGDRQTTVWKARGVHFPTVIMGRYFERESSTVAEKFDGTKIPVTVHVDKDSMTDWGIRPKALTPLGGQAVNALNIYRELFGVDYPHGKLDLVNEPFNFIGAQAPDSIVYVGSGSFRGDAWVAANVRDAGRIAERLNSLVAHEVAHQWFGGVIGNRNMRHYWFVEALAEYASALFAEIVESDGYQKPEQGRKAYLKQVAAWRKQTLETDIMNSVQNCRVGWLGADGQSAYLALVYAKGPYAFHVLRETFGDEKFFAFLKSLVTELQGQNIVTRDIQRIAEKSFGGTMEWFFDQWIRGVGIPEYNFKYDAQPTEDGGFIVQGTIEQRVVAGLKQFELEGVYYRGMVPVTVLGKDRQEYRKKLLVEGPETTFAMKVPVRPVEVSLNKEGEILALPVRVNKAW